MEGPEYERRAERLSPRRRTAFLTMALERVRALYAAWRSDTDILDQAIEMGWRVALGEPVDPKTIQTLVEGIDRELATFDEDAPIDAEAAAEALTVAYRLGLLLAAPHKATPVRAGAASAIAAISTVDTEGTGMGSEEEAWHEQALTHLAALSDEQVERESLMRSLGDPASPSWLARWAR